MFPVCRGQSASQVSTGVLQPVVWSHSLAGCREMLVLKVWASKVANLGIPGMETEPKLKLSRHHPLWALTEELSWSVTSWFRDYCTSRPWHHGWLPSFRPCAPFKLEPAEQIKSRARFHHLGRGLSSYCLHQVGFIFLLFPSRVHTDTACRPILCPVFSPTPIYALHNARPFPLQPCSRSRMLFPTSSRN